MQAEELERLGEGDSPIADAFAPDFAEVVRENFKTSGVLRPTALPPQNLSAAPKRDETCLQLEKQRAKLGCSFTLQQIPYQALNSLRGR